MIGNPTCTTGCCMASNAGVPFAYDESRGRIRAIFWDCAILIRCLTTREDHPQSFGYGIFMLPSSRESLLSCCYKGLSFVVIPNKIVTSLLVLD